MSCGTASNLTYVMNDTSSVWKRQLVHAVIAQVAHAVPELLQSKQYVHSVA